MSIEQIKQFLKPDWKKILLTLIPCLFLIYTTARSCPFEPWLCGEISYLDVIISVRFLIIAIFFYFISCLIIFVFDKHILTKENIKLVFVLNKRKIILFIILFFSFQVFFGDPYRIAICDPCGCNHRWGYPFTFIQEIMKKPKIPNNFNLLSEHSFCGLRYKTYNYLNLFYDLIFWYLISCLLISAWDKIRNKKSPK